MLLNGFTYGVEAVAVSMVVAGVRSVADVTGIV